MLSEEYHGLPCFHLNRHWEEGKGNPCLYILAKMLLARVHWCAVLLKDWSARSPPEHSSFVERSNVPMDWALEAVWSESSGLSESSHQGEPWEASY